MIFLPPAYQLALLGVFDPGVPNRERIVFRPTEECNLLSFIVAIALRGDDQLIHPLTDQTFWFPDQVVAPPSWVFLYTGPGRPQQSVLPETGHPAYTLHWGKQQTVFSDKRIVPAIFGLASMLQPPPAVQAPIPQLRPPR